MDRRNPIRSFGKDRSVPTFYKKNHRQTKYSNTTVRDPDPAVPGEITTIPSNSSPSADVEKRVRPRGEGGWQGGRREQSKNPGKALASHSGIPGSARQESADSEEESSSEKSSGEEEVSTADEPGDHSAGEDSSSEGEPAKVSDSDRSGNSSSENEEKDSEEELEEEG